MLLFFCSGSTTPQVVMEMLQHRHTLVLSIRPCPSYNLAAHKVFIEILEPWAVAHLQR
jgi:hypothetical protein